MGGHVYISDHALEQLAKRYKKFVKKYRDVKSAALAIRLSIMRCDYNIIKEKEINVTIGEFTIRVIIDNRINKIKDYIIVTILPEIKQKKKRIVIKDTGEDYGQ